MEREKPSSHTHPSKNARPSYCAGTSQLVETLDKQRAAVVRWSAVTPHTHQPLAMGLPVGSCRQPGVAPEVTLGSGMYCVLQPLQPSE